MSHNKTIIIAVSVLALVFVGFIVFGLTRQSAASQKGNLSSTLRPAPDFTLTYFSGEQVSLSTLKGKPVVINFWASWCPPCRDEAPVLQKVWMKYKDKGLIFIGVDVQDTADDAAKFMKQFGITYLNGPDKGGFIARDYGITGVPETYFINKEGQLVGRWIGAIGEGILTAHIEEIMR